MSLVAVCSGKGSPGATFVALNLAAALARAGDETLLLDLDPFGGDLAAYLGLDPRRGLYPLMRMTDRAPGTETLLREAEDRDGLLCVGGFPETFAFEAEIVVELLRAATESGKVVIADIGRVATETAWLARAADLVLVAVRPDLVSVLGAERALRILRAWCAHDQLRAVVSGTERRRPGDVKEIADAIRTPLMGSIPLDRRSARRALIEQRPCVKGSAVRGFTSLAAQVREHLAAIPTVTPQAEVANA